MSAEGQTLGRHATRIADTLRGKGKPSIGELIDGVGRRESLISGLAIMAVSTVMLAWAESIL